MSHRTPGRALVALAVLLSLAPQAGAWGSKGHEVVGFIADAHLTDTARAELRSFCKSPSLAFLANWADAIRDDHPETAPWHYCNLPPDAARFVPERDVPPQGCVVDRLEHFRDVLADRTAPPAARLEALRWLTHLVGDLHQPLHCSRAADRGGNSIDVEHEGDTVNLHSFWDTTLVEAQGLSARRYADRLLAEIDGEDRAAWEGGAAADWATESWGLARTMAYTDARGRPVEDGAVLGRRYVTSRTVVVDEQLRKAGVRLAWIVNEALGGGVTDGGETDGGPAEK